MRLSIYTDASIIKRPLTEDVIAVGIGIVILDKNGREIKAISRSIDETGNVTSNRAEMMGVIEGLKEAKRLGATEVDFYNDLESISKVMGIMLKNMSNEKVQYSKSFLVIRDLALQFEKCNFYPIKRRLNKRADSLARSIAREVREELVLKEVLSLPKSLQKKLFFKIGNEFNLIKLRKEKSRF